MLQIEKLQRIDLGIMGENAARTITIDCSAWTQMYPNGAISVYHRRPGEEEPGVTGASYEASTGILEWSPTEYDTFYAGEGVAQIRVTEGNVIKKSIMLPTIIRESFVNESGDALESNWESYINEVERLKNGTVAAKNGAVTAQGAAEGAQAAAEAARIQSENARDAARATISHYPHVNPATKTWWVWNVTTEHWEDTGVSAEGLVGPQGPEGPRGPKGDTGDPGVDGHNAVVVDAGPYKYGFSIDENYHLILTYDNEEAPNYAINSDGHLIYTFGEEE